MKTYIIQLDEYDDVRSIMDKITWSKALRIVLDFPIDRRFFLSELDLKLILRQSKKLGAQLALVTESLSIQRLCKELSVPVFSTVDQAQRENWIKFRKNQAATFEIDKSRQSGIEKIKETRKKQKTRPLSLPARVVLFLLGILSVISVSLLFLPGAQVKLELAKPVQKIELPISAAESILAPTILGQVPLYTQTFLMEGREQIAATGRNIIPDGYATGIIRIENISDTDIFIPQGTVFTTLDEPVQRFILGEDLDIQADEFVETTLTALQPGLAGNVAAGRINAVESEIGLSVSVENPSSFSGGSEMEIPVPVETDIENLKASITNNLLEAVMEELSTTGNEEKFFILETLQVDEIISESSNLDENETADFAVLTMQIQFICSYIKRSDLQQAAYLWMENDLDEEYESRETLPAIDIQETMVQGNGLIEISIIAEREIYQSQVSEKSAQILIGISVSDALNLLNESFELLSQPEISVFPEWWSRMPFLPMRLEVIEK